jgi:hypothetical protein
MRRRSNDTPRASMPNAGAIIGGVSFGALSESFGRRHTIAQRDIWAGVPAVSEP